MASSAKKRAVEMVTNGEKSENSSDDSIGDEEGSADDSEDSDEEIDEVVMVDFEAHAIAHTDFNGIKKLLQQLFLKAHVNTSDLTDLIIQQNHIGSVVRQAEVPEDSDGEDNPDEVFGFISMLNLTERKGVQCVEEVKDLIMDHCEKSCSGTVAEQLETIFSDASKSVGLLLSERFINVPPQIALPLHKQLQEEIAEAQRTNQPSGKCHYCLMISKTCKEVTKRAGSRAHKEELLFVNAEEEFFYEHATVKFNYSVQDETDSCLSGRWSFDDVPMKPFRTVMLIPADSIPSIMEKLKEFLTV